MNSTRWIRVVKTVIGLVVAVGLIVAMRKASLQWQRQLQMINGQIESIDSRIAIIKQALPETSGAESVVLSDLRRQRLELLRSVPSLANLHWRFILISAVFYALSLFPPGWLLHKAVGVQGQSCGLIVATSAQVLGHLGKYVPGKAMVVLIRAGILKQHGVALSVATVSVFIETFLMMAVGGVIGGTLIWQLPAPGWIRYSALGVAAFAVIPTLPPVLRRVLTVFRNRSAGSGDVPEVRSLWGVFAVGWISAAIAWACVAASFTFLVVAIPNPQSLTLANVAVVASAAICLAAVLGFASLIPGGVGVRELVLVGVLAPVVGPSHAVVAAIAARILFLVVECLCFAVGWSWLNVSRPRRPASSIGESV